MKLKTVIETHQNFLPCEPPLWALNGHAQTILGFFCPHPSVEKFDSIAEIPTHDQEHLWGGVLHGTKPVVVTILHGLGGDVNSFFVQRSLRVAKSLDYTAIAINHRGVGEGMQLSQNIYHGCKCEDLQSISTYVEKNHPGSLHVMVGVSLSGNMILNWLGTFPDAKAPDLSVVFNAPIQFEKATHQLRKGINRIYDIHFMNLLKDSLKEREKMGLDLDHITPSKVWSVHDFNSVWITPLGGFESVEDYYDKSSSFHSLDKIKSQVLVVTSEDDPFIDYNDYKAANWSPSCHVRIEKNGGHGCYIQKKKNSFGDNFWLDEYLLHVLSQIS